MRLVDRLRRLMGLRSTTYSPTPLSGPSSWLVDLFGQRTVSGESISEESSLCIPAVWACVRVISDTVGSLPLKVYARSEGRNRSPTYGTSLYKLLHDAPNEYQTSMTWRETMMIHTLLWGNHVSYVEKNFSNNPVALHPARPWSRVEKKGNKLIYTLVFDDGYQYEAPGDRVIHIKGPSLDGLRGLSTIASARESLGLTTAAEKFGSRFFANDARPGVWLEHPTKLGEEAYSRLKDTFQAAYSGDNQHKVAVLEGGAKLHEVGIPPEDAQFLETRKFQTNEIARWFRVPPHMIGDLERATFSNIEQQDINFTRHTIRPWLVRIEQELNSKLFRSDRSFAEFEVDGLLRGDFKTRMEGYVLAVTNGLMTRNEVRQKETMNSLPGLDEPLTPMNMSVDGGTGDVEEGSPGP